MPEFIDGSLLDPATIPIYSSPCVIYDQQVYNLVESLKVSFGGDVATFLKCAGN